MEGNVPEHSCRFFLIFSVLNIGSDDVHGWRQGAQMKVTVLSEEIMTWNSLSILMRIFRVRPYLNSKIKILDTFACGFPFLGFLIVGLLRYPGIRALGIRSPGHPTTRLSATWPPGHPATQAPDHPATGLLATRPPDHPAIWPPGRPARRTPGHPATRPSGHSATRPSGHPVTQTQDLEPIPNPRSGPQSRTSF